MIPPGHKCMVVGCIGDDDVIDEMKWIVEGSKHSDNKWLDGKGLVKIRG